MKIYEEVYNDTLSAEILDILNGAGTEEEKIQAILDAADRDYNINGNDNSIGSSAANNTSATADTSSNISIPQSSNSDSNQGQKIDKISTDKGGIRTNSSNNQNIDSMSAQEAADKAQEAADKAQEAADAAQNAANAAQDTANKAQEAADAAQDDANAAQDTANKAQEAADAAQDAADKAQDKAQELQNNQDSQNSDDTVKNAQDDANTAQENADKAQNTANTAQENADKAQDAANKAQEAADKAQEAADKAQDIANAAQDAADAAQDAADAAQEAANNKNDDIAKEKAKEAASELDKARNKAKDAGAKDQTDNYDEDDMNNQNKQERNDAGYDYDEDDNIEDDDDNNSDDSFADNQEDNDIDNNSQNNNQDQDKDNQNLQNQNDDFDYDIKDDFQTGRTFGEFLGGLIYQAGGDPKIVLDKLHFDDIYELPTLPHMKLTDYHNIDFSEVHESVKTVNEEYDSAAILSELRDALRSSNVNNNKKLTKILSVLAKRKNGNIDTTVSQQPIQQEPSSQEQQNKTAQSKQEKVDKNQDIWKNVKIAVADGDCEGTGSLFGDSHVMTGEMRKKLEDARSEKLKRTTSDKESPFSTEHGIVKTLERITNRVFGKGGDNNEENEAKKNIERIKERIRANRKGFINWVNLLLKYLKGINFKREKNGLTSRSIVDPMAPAKYYYDPIGQIGNKLVVYLDCSGSVLGVPGRLAQVVTELKEIAKQCSFATLDLICFDDGILEKYCLIEQRPNEIRSDGWTINTPPSGGTTYDAVYKHMFKYYALNKKVSAVLIFSDQDVTWSSNIFNNWKKKHSKEGTFIQSKLGKKCIFIGIGQELSSLPEFQVAVIPGTKCILVSNSDFDKAMKPVSVDEALNITNNNMSKNYFSIDNNINEMAFKSRKTPTASEPVAENPDSTEKSDKQDNTTPEETVDLQNMKMDDLLARSKQKSVVAANMTGSSLYEGNIDKWMNNVFKIWGLKKVAGTQAMIGEPQSYCVILKNDIFRVAINNELTSYTGSKMKAHTAQAARFPDKAFLYGNLELGEAAVNIVSYKGSLEVVGFKGDKLPKFFPQRITGGFEGKGGDLHIINCPNLSSLENWPKEIEGRIYIHGKINISEDELEDYNDNLIAVTNKKRQELNLEPISEYELKVISV